MTDKTELTKGVETFILNWAEAVAGWGLPRSAGRLHGLLLVADGPMAAEDLATTLGVARSNISTSLRDLMAMGVIEAVPEIGERRTRYVAVSAPDAIAAAVMAHQKARLFDPVLDVLADAELEGTSGKRIGALSNYAAALEAWLESAEAPSGGQDTKPKKKKKKKG